MTSAGTIAASLLGLSKASAFQARGASVMRSQRRHHMCKTIILSLLCVIPLLSHASESCEGIVGSLSGKVAKEKVLCISDGGCVQEITVQLQKRTQTVTNSLEPWVEEGEIVTILKLEGAYLPGFSYRGRAGGNQSYLYKLARYCEA
jgi:hypothetical protein